MKFIPYFDRSIILQLELNEGTIKFVQVYAATVDKEDDEIEK